MDNIIEKIKKLLDLSKSKNIHEAAAAAKAAEALISKYRISEAELSSSDTESLPVEDINILYETARVVSWKSSLAIRLAKHYGCAIFNDALLRASKSGQKVSRYRLVGQQSDLDLTRFMFGWLTSEIERLCKYNCRGQGHIVAQSYCEGAVKGVLMQLQEAKDLAKKVAEEAGQSMALIKLDNRESQALNVLNSLHNLRKSSSKSHRHLDSDAFHQGVEHGKSMHIASGLKEGSSTKLLK